MAGFGKTLADFTTTGNITSPAQPWRPTRRGRNLHLNYIGLVGMTARATARCDSLAAKGLVSGADTAARAQDALNKLRAFGWTPRRTRCTTPTMRWATAHPVDHVPL